MRRLPLLMCAVPALLVLAACDDTSNVVGTSPKVSISGTPGHGPTAVPSVPGGNPTPRSQLPVPTYP